jgi:hypothetical protein
MDEKDKLFTTEHLVPGSDVLKGRDGKTMPIIVIRLAWNDAEHRPEVIHTINHGFLRFLQQKDREGALTELLAHELDQLATGFRSGEFIEAAKERDEVEAAQKADPAAN